jgi:hypothetical protein
MVLRKVLCTGDIKNVPVRLLGTRFSNPGALQGHFLNHPVDPSFMILNRWLQNPGKNLLYDSLGGIPPRILRIPEQESCRIPSWAPALLGQKITSSLLGP